MTDDFFRTRMGHTYYNGTLPQMVREVGRLADSIAALNETLLERLRPPLPAVAPTPTRTAHARLRVLVVDDDEHVLRGQVRVLKQDHEVLRATSAEAALAILGAHEVDALITDHCMPESSVAVSSPVARVMPTMRRFGALPRSRKRLTYRACGSSGCTVWPAWLVKAACATR